ncbi:ThiF family adenylyltransferase [Aestuariibius sp. HNIBRBA575]|uniref:ThiF family adenylyltransferase n=1 Tax=Aestuariibius sp. HNIBRBA575 TaxID=3233343 RepID=UPI0034A30E55
MNRYARQMILPEIGQAGQDRLRDARVLVVGAGGLGCPALQYLVGAGVGQITIIDPDHVEETNLHRQPLFKMSDLGTPKAEAAAAHLQAANPDVHLRAFVASLNPGNASDLVRNSDVVVDAADSFAVSYILSDTCQDLGVPFVSASALGFTGYVGAFCATAPSLRAVFPDLPSRSATCASVGVLGPVVGTIGAIQAQITLQILLKLDPSPLGQMTRIDLQNLRFGGFDFRSAPEPETQIPFISTSAITASDQVVELRDMSEFSDKIAPQAQRIDVADIDRFQPEQDRRVVLVCATGLRAWRAANMLIQANHTNLALLAARANS